MDAVIFGLVLGGLYALLAQSFVLTFITTKTLNFAVGEFVALGAFVVLAVASWSWLPAAGKIAIGFLAAGLVGALAYRFLVLPFTTQGEHDVRWLLSTVALSFVMLNLIGNVEGPSPQRSDTGRLGGSVEILGSGVSKQMLLIALLAVAVSIALIVASKKTSMGLIMRAVSQDKEVTSLMGVSPHMVGAVSYLVAMGLAGLAGTLYAATVGASPVMGAPLLVASIAVGVIGGLSSLWGPLLGGALYGVLSQVASFEFGAIWGETAGLLLVIAVLIWKPEGLLGRRMEVKL
ncbi:branched-subunit amino acid ABC-type transport system permease component [Nocardioides daedukensis]|uniref:Branched-subunit amino acid ABC-type transport system permease component n=1 Tax=Nocardioides daedukensis TaxID=634462 RepID=A0A7Y9UW02_9ACTN|nr:branched-chain amino acid ABC transporter permease [Nocardioides daedukensis]NYG59880.1 branched-subunit amino acid ABC-type transport system permease component [Nocardioides daedukensis]